MQGAREAFQVLGTNPNDAASRAVHVGYEKERDGNNQRKDEKTPDFVFNAVSIETNKQIAADSDRCHQTPPVCAESHNATRDTANKSIGDSQNIRHIKPLNPFQCIVPGVALRLKRDDSH
jgi:hypothetical protein